MASITNLDHHQNIINFGYKAISQTYLYFICICTTLQKAKWKQWKASSSFVAKCGRSSRIPSRIPFDLGLMPSAEGNYLATSVLSGHQSHH